MKLMQHHIILNWTGRITGILVTAFFAAFFVSEGIPDILNGKGDELLQFLPQENRGQEKALCSFSWET